MSRGGIDGLHVNLVATILHVYQAAVFAVKEFRITLAAGTAALDFFLEEVMAFAVAGQYATIGSSFGQEGIFLQNGFEVDTEVRILNHGW